MKNNEEFMKKETEMKKTVALVNYFSRNEKLLWGDDYLSWNDDADGSFCFDSVVEKSVQWE